MENYDTVNTLLKPIITIFLTYWIVWLLIYLFPYIVAVVRKHRNSISILILNVFFGWTFVGWVVSLVWAFTSYPTTTIISGAKKDRKR